MLAAALPRRGGAFLPRHLRRRPADTSRAAAARARRPQTIKNPRGRGVRTRRLRPAPRRPGVVVRVGARVAVAARGGAQLRPRGAARRAGPRRRREHDDEAPGGSGSFGGGAGEGRGLSAREFVRPRVADEAARRRGALRLAESLKRGRTHLARRGSAPSRSTSSQTHRRIEGMSRPRRAPLRAARPVRGRDAASGCMAGGFRGFTQARAPLRLRMGSRLHWQSTRP